MNDTDPFADGALEETVAVLDGESTVPTNEGPKCVVCGAILVIGSYPFCKGNPADHDTIRSEWARRFEPLLVDINAETGAVSYPGASTDEVPAGYYRRSLETIHQIEEFCNARSREETEKRRDQIRGERQFWDQRVKERREAVRALIAKQGFRGEGWEKICRFIDARRERKYDDLMRRQVNVFSDVLHFDASNRESYSSEQTGWKQRKA